MFSHERHCGTRRGELGGRADYSRVHPNAPVCRRCKDESSPSFCLPKRSDDHADRAGDYKFNPLVSAEIQTGADWFADDFVITHHRNRYYSGCGEALLGWLDEFVRKTYYEQHDSQQQVCGRGPGGPKLSLC
jgi:hypothetical protein